VIVIHRLLGLSGEPLNGMEMVKTVSVSFELNWTAITKQFDFDTDLNPSALSASIAREPWTRSFFNSLRLLVFHTVTS